MRHRSSSKRPFTCRYLAHELQLMERRWSIGCPLDAMCQSQHVTMFTGTARDKSCCSDLSDSSYLDMVRRICDASTTS